MAKKIEKKEISCQLRIYLVIITFGKLIATTESCIIINILNSFFINLHFFTTGVPHTPVRTWWRSNATSDFNDTRSIVLLRVCSGTSPLEKSYLLSLTMMVYYILDGDLLNSALLV